MLIDTHEPCGSSPPTGGRTWQLGEWSGLLFVVAGLVLVLLSSLFLPLPAYVVILAACALIGRGLGEIGRIAPGLRDYRQ